MISSVECESVNLGSSHTRLSTEGSQMWYHAGAEWDFWACRKSAPGSFNKGTLLNVSVELIRS